jgi:hypothetical protein
MKKPFLKPAYIRQAMEVIDEIVANLDRENGKEPR